MTDTTTPTDHPNRDIDLEARLTAVLAAKALVIAVAIVVLMIVWRARPIEMFLVGTISWCAAMLMALAEYDAIAAGRRGR